MTYELYLSFGNIMLIISMVAAILLSILLYIAHPDHYKRSIYLSIFLCVIALWLLGIVLRDINLNSYYPILNWVPFSLTLALGPSLYLHIKVNYRRPQTEVQPIDRLHYSPVAIHLFFQAWYVYESYDRGVLPLYQTNMYEVLNPIAELITLVSIMTYIFLSSLEIRTYQKYIEANFSNSADYNIIWLTKSIRSFGLMWALWVPFTLYDYLLENYDLPVNHYYAVYSLISLSGIWIGVNTLLKPAPIEDLPIRMDTEPDVPSADIIEKSIWLDAKVSSEKQYLNPELTLRMLADDCAVHHNTLTKIINQGLGKSFSDYINQFRIDEVTKKMTDPRFKHLTFEGIAYECGFNSKSTFNRSFKKATGTNPATYLKRKMKDQNA